MHFSATATHFGVSKTTQTPQNQSCHHLQQQLSFKDIQFQPLGNTKKQTLQV
jgi:hypothetical protein